MITFLNKSTEFFFCGDRELCQKNEWKYYYDLLNLKIISIFNSVCKICVKFIYNLWRVSSLLAEWIKTSYGQKSEKKWSHGPINVFWTMENKTILVGSYKTYVFHIPCTQIIQFSQTSKTVMWCRGLFRNANRGSSFLCK